jgi:hypothetical protein
MLLSENGAQSPAYDLLSQASRIQEQLNDHSRSHTLELLAHVCDLQGRQEDARRYQSLADSSRMKTPDVAVPE